MLTLTQAGHIANQHLPFQPMTDQEDLDNLVPQFGPGFYSTYYNRYDDTTIYLYERDGKIILDAEYRDSLWGDGGWANHTTICQTAQELEDAIRAMVGDRIEP